jgi:hypothetical protein
MGCSCEFLGLWRYVRSRDDWKEECELLASMSSVLVPLYSLMYLEAFTASCTYLYEVRVSHTFVQEETLQLCG